MYNNALRSLKDFLSRQLGPRNIEDLKKPFPGPDENTIWTCIAAHSSPTAQVLLALSCHEAWFQLAHTALAFNSSASRVEKLHLLLLIGKDLPGHRVCSKCFTLHPKSTQLRQNSCDERYVLIKPFRPERCDPQDPPFEMKISWPDIQNVMLQQVYGGDHGIPIDSLRQSKSAKVSAGHLDWFYTVVPAISRRRLLLRVETKAVPKRGIWLGEKRAFHEFYRIAGQSSLVDKNNCKMKHARCKHLRVANFEESTSTLRGATLRTIVAKLNCAPTHTRFCSKRGIGASGEVMEPIQSCVECEPPTKCPWCSSTYLVRLLRDRLPEKPESFGQESVLVCYRYIDLGGIDWVLHETQLNVYGNHPDYSSGEESAPVGDAPRQLHPYYRDLATPRNIIDDFEEAVSPTERSPFWDCDQVTDSPVATASVTQKLASRITKHKKEDLIGAASPAKSKSSSKEGSRATELALSIRQFFSSHKSSHKSKI